MEEIRINTGTPASEVIKVMARLRATGRHAELREVIDKLSFEQVSAVRELLTVLRDTVDGSLLAEVAP